MSNECGTASSTIFHIQFHYPFESERYGCSNDFARKMVAVLAGLSPQCMSHVHLKHSVFHIGMGKGTLILACGHCARYNSYTRTNETRWLSYMENPMDQFGCLATGIPPLFSILFCAQKGTMKWIRTATLFDTLSLYMYFIYLYNSSSTFLFFFVAFVRSLFFGNVRHAFSKNGRWNSTASKQRKAIHTQMRYQARRMSANLRNLSRGIRQTMLALHNGLVC